jgi:hypothetical protein
MFQQRFIPLPEKGTTIEVAMATHDGTIWVACEVMHSSRVCFDIRYPGGQYREFWFGEEGWRAHDRG